MIIAAIKMKGRQEKRLEIIQSLNGFTSKILEHKGCKYANCYQDINDQDIFYHVQEWQSQEEFDAHRDSKLFAALLGLQSILAAEPQIDFMYRNGD